MKEIIHVNTIIPSQKFYMVKSDTIGIASSFWSTNITPLWAVPHMFWHLEQRELDLIVGWVMFIKGVNRVRLPPEGKEREHLLSFYCYNPIYMKTKLTTEKPQSTNCSIHSSHTKLLNPILSYQSWQWCPESRSHTSHSSSSYTNTYFSIKDVWNLRNFLLTLLIVSVFSFAN